MPPELLESSSLAPDTGRLLPSKTRPVTRPSGAILSSSSSGSPAFTSTCVTPLGRPEKPSRNQVTLYLPSFTPSMRNLPDTSVRASYGSCCASVTCCASVNRPIPRFSSILCRRTCTSLTPIRVTELETEPSTTCAPSIPAPARNRHTTFMAFIIHAPAPRSKPRRSYNKPSAYLLNRRSTHDPQTAVYPYPRCARRHSLVRPIRRQPA